AQRRRLIGRRDGDPELLVIRAAPAVTDRDIHVEDAREAGVGRDRQRRARDADRRRPAARLGIEQGRGVGIVAGGQGGDQGPAGRAAAIPLVQLAVGQDEVPLVGGALEPLLPLTAPVVPVAAGIVEAVLLLQPIGLGIGAGGVGQRVPVGVAGREGD